MRLWGEADAKKRATTVRCGRQWRKRREEGRKFGADVVISAVGALVAAELREDVVKIAMTWALRAKLEALRK
jgi:hypothetical protein